MIDEKDRELVRFMMMRGLGYDTDDIKKEIDTVGSAIYIRRKKLREQYESSEYNDIIEFFQNEVL